MMKRTRSIEDGVEGADELDPLAVALLALGGHPGHQLGVQSNRAQTSKRVRARQQQEPAVDVPKQQNVNYGRRGYVWRGPHREELSMHKKQQLSHFELVDGHNSSSRRSSATTGIASDEDEVADEEQQQLSTTEEQLPHRSTVKQQKQKQKQQPKSKQRQQHSKHGHQQKDAGKEWAALTTWLRMNLHHPRTHRRVIMFLGQQDCTTGAWTFSLNPELSWQEVGLETKLRLKTLLVEAEQAYLQKYPGRPRLEWGSKLQKYKPPGTTTTAEVTLWDVVNSLHAIYLQHEDTAADMQPAEQLQQGDDHQQPLQQGMMQQQEWCPGFCADSSAPGAAAPHHYEMVPSRAQQQEHKQDRERE